VMLVALSIMTVATVVFIQKPPEPWLLVSVVVVFSSGTIVACCAMVFAFNRPPDIRTLRRLRGQCQDCGYQLNSGMRKCPECGSGRRI
jgi:hypothetical protein